MVDHQILCFTKLAILTLIPTQWPSRTASVNRSGPGASRSRRAPRSTDRVASTDGVATGGDAGRYLVWLV